MKKVFGAAGLALAGLLVATSPAVARETSCSGTVTGASYEDVVVPRGGACTLVDSTVTGDVKVLKDAYFQSTDTKIGGDVLGTEAQTIFVDKRTQVTGSIKVRKTIQVFIFNSRVTQDIDIDGTGEVVQICGTTLQKGDVLVQWSGRDILIGDPKAASCRGNTLKRGNLSVRRSFADVEFVIRGNYIKKGNLEVFRNTGPVRKYVEDNTGGDRLKCSNNSRLRISANTGWAHKQRNCS
jgi:hypothetical protein